MTFSTDIYKEIGYESNKIGYGEKAGVAVVDLQLGFTDPKYDLGGLPMVDRATENTAVLLKAARAARLPVASCYTAYSSARDAPYWKLPIVLNEFHHGHPCTEFDPRIYEPGYDTVFCKRAPSIFFETGAVQYFLKERVDTVIVTGCTTSGCVRASIVDAFSYGFRVIVPEPCVGDVEEGPHRDNLRDVHRRYADVVELEDVMNFIEDYRGRNRVG